MHHDSNNSDQFDSLSPKKHISVLKKNALVIAAKKDLLDSEYFFDNKPSLFVKNKNSISFDK
jgi:hypothetical protein